MLQMIPIGFVLLAFLFGASAANFQSPQLPLTEVQLLLLDNDAIAYGTFQSHNQKVVSTPKGVFVTHLHKSNTNQPAQIRLGFEDGSWSEWHAFGQELVLATPTERGKPQQYQLRSRLDVLPPPQTFPK